jgi:hypothetical protein
VSPLETKDVRELSRSWIVGTSVILAASLAVLSNWLPRPARLGVRWTAVAFLVVLAVVVAFAVVTQQPDGAAPTSAVAISPNGASAAASSRFVTARKVTPFGAARVGGVPFEVDGEAFTIGSLPTLESQSGFAVPGAHRCNVSITVDASLQPGSTDYYGFAIGAKASVVNDKPIGSFVMFYRDSGGEFIAKHSGWPGVGVGGIGGGSYPIASPLTQRHIVVNDLLEGLNVTVDGQQTGEYSLGQDCGIPVFAVWGGATLRLDRILIS